MIHATPFCNLGGRGQLDPRERFTAAKKKKEVPLLHIWPGRIFVSSPFKHLVNHRLPDFGDEVSGIGAVAGLDVGGGSHPARSRCKFHPLSA
jgi:hypothetical protein